MIEEQFLTLELFPAIFEYQLFISEQFEIVKTIPTQSGLQSFLSELSSLHPWHISFIHFTFLWLTKCVQSLSSLGKAKVPWASLCFRYPSDVPL